MLRVLRLLCLLIGLIQIAEVFATPPSEKLSAPIYEEPNSSVIQQQKNQAGQAINQSDALINKGEVQKILLEEQSKINQLPRQPGLSVQMPGFLQSQRTDRYLSQALDASQAIAKQQQDKANLPGDKCPIVLVSFSMPDNQLKALIAEAHKVGAVVAIRGLVNDDFKQTLIKLRQLTDTNNLEQESNSQLCGIIIDPTLFRRFSVSAVPTFILPLESLQPCSEQGCAVPEHVQATGSATLKYFLDLIVRTGSKAEQQAAQVWLAKYEN